MLKRKEMIGIVVGSNADLKVLLSGLRWLKESEVPYRVYMASVYQLDQLKAWLVESVQDGIEVFIVAQGGSALLPGIVSAQTLKPVIAIPLDTSRQRGQEAQHSIGNLPGNHEILMTGINGVDHAFRSAIRILALKDANFQKLNEQLRYQEMEEIDVNRKLQEQRFKDLLKPDFKSKALKGVITSLDELPEVEEKEEPVVVESEFAQSKIPVLRVDRDNPDIDMIEKAAGQILNGEVVAIPTDTVYGLAVDATNSSALDKLIAIKGRAQDHPFPVMICNETQLKQIAKDVPSSVMDKMDDYWPGALTLVFEKYTGSFTKVSPNDTIGLRIPDDIVMLNVLSAVNRPLAVTSANPTGHQPATTIEQILDYFKSELALALDSGPSPSLTVSTVLDVREEPFKILREGMLDRDRLIEIFGEIIE